LGKPLSRNVVVAALIVNEGLSVLENLTALGVKIPKFLRQVLELAKEMTDKGEDPSVSGVDKPGE
jgi:phage-related holin